MVTPGGQIHKVIYMIPIFGVILGQNLSIGPRRVITYRVTATVWSFILTKSYHALFQRIFCGYVALSSDPNWEVICIIPIFVVKIWVFYLPG